MTRRSWVAVVAGSLGAVALAWGVATTHVRLVTRSPHAVARPCWNCHGTPRFQDLRHARRHPEPWTLVASADGGTLFAACGPQRSIAVLDVAAGTRASRLDLPGRPRGLALSADGATLYAALSDADAVAAVNLSTGEVARIIPAGTSPAGLALGDGGRRLFVANSGSHDVSVIDLATGAERTRLPAGREPWALAASPDGATIAVVSRMADAGPADRVPRAELTLIDAARGIVSAQLALPSCHLSESLAFTPDGARVLVPALRVRNLLPIMQVARGWVMSSVLAVVEVATGRIELLPLGDVSQGFPDPAGLAVSADGTRAFVAAGGADEVGVIDVPALLRRSAETDADGPEHLSWTREYVTDRFPTGSNPRGVVLAGSAASPVVAVAERLDDSVSLYRPGGERIARIALARGRSDDALRRGERVFHDASYSFQGSFSCRSCHPEGQTDGLTYDFDIDGIGRNVVLNRSLQGVRDTAPFKWNGKNPTLQRQCGPRFAMVLTRADPFPDAELEDLVAFIESLPAPRPAVAPGDVAGRDTGAVARGRAIFERAARKDGTPFAAEGRCVTCHVPPLFTNKQEADVGTRGAYDDRGAFDVPHLTGIGSKAPYLHDGRALTLEAIWTAPDVGDKHGVVTDLTKSDLNDLVAYLRSL